MDRLGVRDARVTSWREGIEDAYEKHDEHVVYVTPPIEGWLLVAGTSLFAHFSRSKEDDARIPAKNPHRPHTHGSPRRAGPEGPPATADGKKAYQEWASHQVNEEMVTRVAGQWSVNPNVEGRRLPPGWLGTLPP